MAGGKTLIGGTAYTIKGGKTLVGGTAYSIKKGKTLIGGTAKTIAFYPSLAELFSKATRYTAAGRSSSSTSTVSLSLSNAGTYYVFAYCDGYMSINKVVSTGSALTVTILSGNYVSGTGGMIRVNGTSVYYSNNGTSSTSVYGASLIVFTFSTYTEAQIDACLSSLTMTRVAGRNASSNATITGSTTSTAKLFVAMNSYMAVNCPIGTVVYGNYTTNPSLIYLNGTTVGYSTNGTSNSSSRSGSIISFTE